MKTAVSRWRAIFFALLALGISGTFLVLGANIRPPWVVAITTVALALIPPVYIYLSFSLGLVENWPTSTHREERPVWYWISVLASAAVLTLLVAFPAFMVLTSGT